MRHNLKFSYDELAGDYVCELLIAYFHVILITLDRRFLTNHTLKSL